MDDISNNEHSEDSVYPDLLDSRVKEISNALEVLLEIQENGGDEIAAESSRTTLRDLMPRLYEADLADLFETLPPALRSIAADYVLDHRLATVLNDMSDASAVAMAQYLSDERLTKALKACEDTEEVEGLLRAVAPKRRSEMLQVTGLSKDATLLHSLSFATDTVGELMDFQHICIDSGQSVEEALASIRDRKSLPSQCDKLFVTENSKLVGVLPLKRLIIHPLKSKVRDIMVLERLHTLEPADGIDEAVDLFERYDLVSAPVLNHHNEVMGRVTVDEILGHMRDEQHTELLTSSGLREEEDLYAPIARKLHNRGFWILINLIAAFMVSRIIGAFEGTIIQVVALASLMPIVASMAGNTGMQTATLVIRALALNQISSRNWYVLLGNELLLGLVNGLLWGSMVGLFSLLFYADIALAAVLSVSMTAVFLLAAALGFLVPVTVQKMKGDPALGTSVIVTVILDCLGFLIFLSLAASLLV